MMSLSLLKNYSPKFKHIMGTHKGRLVKKTYVASRGGYFSKHPVFPAYETIGVPAFLARETNLESLVVENADRSKEVNRAFIL